MVQIVMDIMGRYGVTDGGDDVIMRTGIMIKEEQADNYQGFSIGCGDTFYGYKDAIRDIIYSQKIIVYLSMQFFTSIQENRH